LFVNEIMTKEVLSVSPDDNISEVMSLIEREHVHEIFVIDGKRLKGIIHSRKLVTKTIMDPAKTKVSTIMVSPPPTVKSNESVDEVAKILAKTGLRAILVCENNEVVGVVSITDVMEVAAQSKIFRQTPVSSIMSSPDVIGYNEGIGKARVFMREKNITHLPVVDEEGKLKGLITSFDILKSVKRKERMDYYSMEAEMEKITKIPVSTILNKEPITAEKNMPLSEISKLMIKHDIAGVVITENQYPVGIVTPKDLLEFYVSGLQPKGVYYQIIGIDKEDEFVLETADRMIRDFLQKISTVYTPQYLFVHVKRHEEGEKNRIKYSIRTRLMTDRGIFVSKGWEWDLRDAVNHTLRNLEKIIFKKKEISRERSRTNERKVKEL